MNETPMTEVGGAAPAVSLEDGEGKGIPLSRLWGEGPLVLIFLRHLG